MVTDQEIARCVESLLRYALSPAAAHPAAAISVDGVVRQLEATLGLDLSHKASFIRDQIALILRPQQDHFAPTLRPQFPQIIPPSFHRLPASPLPPSSSPSASSPAAAGVPSHHEFSFQYPSPLPVSTTVAVQQQQPPLPAQNPAPAALKPAALAGKESAPTGGKRKGGPGGLNKMCGVSPELQAIVGEPTMSRTQIVKQLWAYIRKNNLQDPNNKRKIICNDELRLVFETDCTDMFKMNKLLAKHIIPLEAPKNPGSDSKKLKAASSDLSFEGGADQCHVILSDALAEFFGTGERAMFQSEVFARVWEYIKNNHLEDPTNAMVILCDSKLQQLFGCENLSALGVPEMLSQHMFKQS